MEFPELDLKPGQYYYSWPDPEIPGAEIRCNIFVEGAEYRMWAYSFHLMTCESHAICMDSESRLWHPLTVILNKLKTD